MRQSRKELVLEVLQRSAEFQGTLLLLLLLLYVQLSNEFPHNYALSNHTVLRGRKETRNMLLYNESSVVRTQDR
jgi:hypothetical protein